MIQYLMFFNWEEVQNFYINCCDICNIFNVNYISVPYGVGYFTIYFSSAINFNKDSFFGEIDETVIPYNITLHNYYKSIKI